MIWLVVYHLRFITGLSLRPVPNPRTMNNFVTKLVLEWPTHLRLHSGFLPAVVWPGRRTTDLGDGTSRDGMLSTESLLEGVPELCFLLEWLLRYLGNNRIISQSHSHTYKNTGQQNQPLLGREEKKRGTAAQKEQCFTETYF